MPMPRISSALAAVGMILAEDVVAPSGQRIAGTGATLTEKHLVAFQTWGVAAIAIAAGSGPAVDPQKLAEARRAVAPRFAGQPTDHPAIREFFRLAVDRHLVRMPK